MSHHSHGFAGLLAHLVLRAAVYRVMWGLPLPVVIALGAVAAFIVWRTMSRTSSRRRP